MKIVSINIIAKNVSGDEVVLSLSKEEAKALWEELGTLFGKSETCECKGEFKLGPLPWEPPPYGPYTTPTNPYAPSFPQWTTCCAEDYPGTTSISFNNQGERTVSIERPYREEDESLEKILLAKRKGESIADKSDQN